MRNDGRSMTQVRPLRFTPNYSKHADGSVLIEVGDTKVLCTATVEDSVPHWMRQQRHSRGWLTAEYSMLPRATNTRVKRERQHPSGRSQEIQRLIGRSLRGILDFSKLPERTIILDCDVLQADGGTRTASITGAYVALKIAIDKLLREGNLKQNPLIDGIAAVSIGIRNESILVDLNYEEDSSADIDLNLVMTHSGKILEIQGTGERTSFTPKQLMEMVEAGQEALHGSFELQQLAADGQMVEA